MLTSGTPSSSISSPSFGWISAFIIPSIRVPHSTHLPSQGHLAFALPNQLPVTAGHRGLAEFYIDPRSGGGLSAIALRFNPSGAFTSAPVYGGFSAIIGVSSGGGSK